MQEATLLALPGPPVLATGAWFESTPARVADGRLHCAPGAGDLIDAEACRRFDAALDALLALHGEPPQAVAHDLHPDFHSTRVALATANRLGVPALAVQHHHARTLVEPKADIGNHGGEGGEQGILGLDGFEVEAAARHPVQHQAELGREGVGYRLEDVVGSCEQAVTVPPPRRGRRQIDL